MITSILADVAPANHSTSHGPQAISIVIVVLIAATILFTLFRNGFRVLRLVAAVFTVLVAAYLIFFAWFLLAPHEGNGHYTPHPPYFPESTAATPTP